MNPKHRRREVFVRYSMLTLAAIFIVGILWIDVATGLWQNLVIGAGLAAGFVTFLLTILVLDRIMARATERRWAPMIRLALTEFLHSMADEEHSEISRGQIVPRLIPQLPESASGETLHEDLKVIRDQVAEERSLLAASLSGWMEILSSTPANEQILVHVAEVALRLDLVRDSALEVEEDPSPEQKAALRQEINECNKEFQAIIVEIEEQLARIAKKGQ